MSTKKYLIKHFDSNQEMEDYINEQADIYRPISIADTNSYITVLLELREERTRRER